MTEETEIIRALDADRLLSEYGKYGRYQILSFLMCQFLQSLYAASLFVMPFIQVKNNFECHTNNQFNILCRSPLVKEAGLMLFSAGAMLVVPIVSHFSDLYGRRKILLISLYSSVIFNTCAAFAPNFVLFVILRFLVGATSDVRDESYMTVGSILSCEVVAGEFRDCTGVVYTVMWTIGYVYVGVLTLCIRKWRYLYLAATLPGAITLIYIWLLPESPHWMASHRDIKGLQKYVDTATIFNSKQVNLNDCVVTEEVQKRPEWEIRRTVLDLFRWKRLLFMISINGFIVLVMNFYYFALSFDSVYLSEDKLTGYLLMGLVELPAGIIAVPVMHRFGRRSISVVCLATQGLILLTAVVFDGWKWSRLICSLIGKTMNSIAFVAHPLLVTEMIPTTLRTVAYSFVNIPESIGILTSPLLKYADLEGGKIPCLILGCLSLVAALLAVVLPETKGHPMPEDIEDMQLGPFLEFFKRRSQRNHT